MSMSGDGPDHVDPILSGPEAEGQGSEDVSAAALRMDLLGASSEDAAAAAAPPRSRLSGQLALLAMVLAAGSGALLAMRYLGMGPRSSQAESVKIDYDLNNSPISVDHNRVLADLSANRSAEQVPPDQVQRNPFKIAGALEGEAPPPDKPAGVDPEVARREREAAARRQEIDRAFASLELHTVLAGSNPVARISGETVRVGDTVAGYFRVVEIQGRSVSLECDGKTYVLSLAEESGAGGKNRRPRR